MIVLVTQLLSEDTRILELEKLDWKIQPQQYKISTKATITTTKNDYLVVGKEAEKYMYIMQGLKITPDAAILRVGGSEVDTQVIYSIKETGYLTKDDWSENIDKDKMLEEIKQGTVQANKKRKEDYLDIFVDDWAQPPYLNTKNNTVYWAIAGHDEDNNKFINAKALKLGREGYTEILWIGSPEQFSSSAVVLKSLLSNYQYNDGFQYEDYIPGVDKVAAAGVGALVYKLATGKAIAKAGFLALMAIFAKKLWFLIFLPFIWLWKKIFNKSK